MLLKNIASMSALSLYRGVVQMGVNIALAAFVPPSEYGLVVFTIPFVLFLSMMTDMGLSSAMIRRPDLSKAQAGAALTLMVTVGIVMTLLMAAGSVPLTAITGMKGLTEIMVAMSVSVLLTVSATAPRALLERELRYGLVAIIEATAVFIAAVAAIAMVWMGAGVWALVVYNVLMNAVRVVAFTIFAREGFTINFHWRELTPLLSFGGWVLANNVLNFFARNAANLLIGGVLGAAAVGLYGLANQFMLIPLVAITWPASGVMLATLSREGLGTDRSRAMVKSVIMATAMVSFPAMIYLTFGMHYPADAFLSEKWRGVEEILRWLAPVGAIQSIASYNGAVLLVAGKARAQFIYSVVNTVATILTFLVTMHHGLQAMVIGYAVISYVLAIGFINLIATMSGIGWRGVLASTAVPALASAAGLAAVWLVGIEMHAGLARWIVSTLTYGVVVLAVFAVFRRNIFQMVQDLRKSSTREVLSPA